MKIDYEFIAKAILASIVLSWLLFFLANSAIDLTPADAPREDWAYDTLSVLPFLGGLSLLLSAAALVKNFNRFGIKKQKTVIAAMLLSALFLAAFFSSNRAGQFYYLTDKAGCLITGYDWMNKETEYCGLTPVSITSEKLKAAGFQGSADMTGVFRSDRACDVKNWCADDGGAAYFLKGTSAHACILKDGCTLFYEISQDENGTLSLMIADGKFSTVPWIQWFDDSVCTKNGDFREKTKITDEFGDKSCETVSDDYVRIAFAKGNKIVIIDKEGCGSHYCIHRPESAGVTLSNAKIVARLVEQSLK